MGRDQEVQLEYSSIRSNLITELDNEIYFHPDPYGGAFFKGFDEDRFDPYTFGGIIDIDYTYSIKIPEGYTVDYLPESISVSNEYYDFTASFILSDTEIKYHKYVKNHKRILPPSEFINWNKTAKLVKEFYNNQIVLIKSE